MKALNGKLVTIFGGSGFIGRYLVPVLCELGYTVRVVGRDPEKAKHLKTSGFVGQVVPVKGNITDTDKLEELIANSYAVINLVGILYEKSKQKFDLVHAQAPEKLAKAAKKVGVNKFIHVSAIVSEDSHSRYARSKINGEKAVLAAFPSASIIKPSVIFGAEDNFLNFFANLSRFLPFLPLIGGGRTKMQPVYVGDIAEAISKCVDDSYTGTYELGGPSTMTFKQIVQRVLLYTGRSRMLLNEPFGLAKLTSYLMPAWLLTADQVELLKHDNVVSNKAKDLKSFGICPRSLDSVVPSYLSYSKAA